MQGCISTTVCYLKVSRRVKWNFVSATSCAKFCLRDGMLYEVVLVCYKYQDMMTRLARHKCYSLYFLEECLILWVLDNRKMDITQCLLHAAGLCLTFAFGMIKFYFSLSVLVSMSNSFIIFIIIGNSIVIDLTHLWSQYLHHVKWNIIRN